MSTVTALYRYPVKGLSPEPMDSMPLEAGAGLAGDRAWALHVGPVPFDPRAPQALEKNNFLALVRYETLATTVTKLNGTTLTVQGLGGGTLATGDLATSDGQAAITAFYHRLTGLRANKTVTVTHAPGHKFTDVGPRGPDFMRAVSVINLSSVRDLERRAGVPIDPMRFRGNILIDGPEPWVELDWEGRSVQIGSVQAIGMLRTQRCAATCVDPATGISDHNVPGLLKQHVGHFDCGVYIQIITSGTVATGDGITVTG